MKKQCEKCGNGPQELISASEEGNTSVVSKDACFFSWDTRAVLHITTSCHDPACKNTRAVYLEEENEPIHELEQAFSYCLDYTPSQKLIVDCVTSNTKWAIGNEE